MELKVYRYNSAVEHTNGVLLIDDIYQCFTLEDEYRTQKVYGETRIVDGIYPIELRSEGGFDERYTAKYDFHRGMLWIKDVPNFQYVLIHIGNDDDDTAGCLLVGTSNTGGSNFTGGSLIAYTDMYNKVMEAFNRNECVTIEFITIDNVNK